MSVRRSALSFVCQQNSARNRSRSLFRRQFHFSQRSNVVKPFLLADIGEGITECQLIQWFVQPGARVEQFDKLCEVQSDKASVEITSPFDGVIKRLHYEPDDMAITGKPLVDIDIQGEAESDNDVVAETEQAPIANKSTADAERSSSRKIEEHGAVVAEEQNALQKDMQFKREDRASLATPAVRHLIREHKIDITLVPGTGKDGRVLKEDVHRYLQQKEQAPETSKTLTPTMTNDRTIPLTPVQNAMFKVMTRSLSIPHFLYTSSADMSAITTLRKELNKGDKGDKNAPKITHLAFIIKAISLALARHPLLNAHLDTTDPKKPVLTHRGSHDFGIAVDSPTGLLVPVIRNVQDLSISGIAARMRELSEAARTNKLSPSDFNGATFTVSNIGSIGGGVVSPVISEPQVAIVGIGRSKVIPAFNEHGDLVKKEELVFSWSADHRVVDGAECARCAESVNAFLERPGKMIAELR